MGMPAHLKKNHTTSSTMAGTPSNQANKYLPISTSYRTVCVCAPAIGVPGSGLRHAGPLGLSAA